MDRAPWPRAVGTKVNAIARVVSTSLLLLSSPFVSFEGRQGPGFGLVFIFSALGPAGIRVWIWYTLNLPPAAWEVTVTGLGWAGRLCLPSSSTCRPA